MSIIKKNFLYNLLLTVSTIIFPIITFPYASRVLGPIGIGKVQFVTSFAQYFVLISALGIPVYGIREVAKRRNDLLMLKKFFTEMIFLNVVTGVIFTLIYLAVIFSVPNLSKDKDFYLIALMLITFNFSNIDWFFSGLERFKFIAVRSLVIKFLSVVLLFFIVKEQSDDVNFLWLTIGVTLANNFWNIWTARSYFHPGSLSYLDLKIHLRPLFYIFSTVAAFSIYGFLDTIILGFLGNYEDVGYYTAASKINKITIPILISLGTVLIPRISQAFKNNDLDLVKYLAKQSFDFVILLGVPLVFGLIVLAPELIIIFSGKNFAPATLTMQIFAPVILIMGLNNVWAIQILTPAGKDKLVTKAVVIGVIVSLLSNVLLIKYFSFNGAAFANVLAEFTVMCGFIYFANTLYKQKFDFNLLFKTIAISLSFIPILILIRRYFSQNNIVVCALGVFFCGIIYILSQIFIVKNENVIAQLAIAKNWLTGLGSSKGKRD